MKDLYSFLSHISDNSDFKATLSERGGFITFSNSGRRGSIKFFQIGLDNLLQTLKDILANLEVFMSLTEYEEPHGEITVLSISPILYPTPILQYRQSLYSQH